MNIEIANKLVKLRKQNGLSQEELADKLGLSRQAVSKWERAEASPDTDNLICLAKLYNVSLDELLSTDDDVDTIVKEQVKKEEKDDSVHISGDTITMTSKEGEEVVIDNKGVHAKNVKDREEFENRRRDRSVYWIVNGILSVIAIITYVLLGVFLKTWATMWIVFFVPDIIMSLAKAIVRRRAHHFNMVFLSLFVFFLICWVLYPSLNLWHPMWTIFLAIPVYYILVNRIEALIEIRNDKVKAIDDEDEDEDDD